MNGLSKVLIIDVVVGLLWSTIHQTIQLEIVTSQLNTIKQHYTITKDTLDYFMRSPRGGELRNEIHKENSLQIDM